MKKPFEQYYVNIKSPFKYVNPSQFFNNIKVNIFNYCSILNCYFSLIIVPAFDGASCMEVKVLFASVLIAMQLLH